MTLIVGVAVVLVTVVEKVLTVAQMVVVAVAMVGEEEQPRVREVEMRGGLPVPEAVVRSPGDRLLCSAKQC